jgi:hypothetical protein
LAKANREKADIEKQLTDELRNLKEKHSRELEERALAQADLTYQIRSLQTRLDAAGKELAARKSVALPIAPPVVQPVATTAPPKEVAKDRTAVVRDLHQQINELNNRLKATKGERNGLIERLRELEAQNQALESSCQEAKTKLKGAAVVHQETVADLDAVRKALHQKETSRDKAEKSRLRRELQSQAAEISRLEKVVASQEAQIQALSLAKTESTRAESAQAAKIVELGQEIRKAEKRIEQLQADLSQADQEMKMRPVLTIDDFLPQTAWLSSDFDGGLNNQIADIVANPALQPASRLQHVYHIINGHFGKLLNAKQRALDRTIQESDSVASAINSFLIGLSIALGFEPITFSDFIGQKWGEKIVNSVASLKTENGDLARANEQYRTLIAQFYNIFQIPQNGDLSAVFHAVRAAGEKCARQDVALRQRSKKCRQLTQTVRSLTRTYQGQIDQLQSQITALNKIIAGLRNDNEELVAANTTLRKDLQTAQHDIQELRQAGEQAEFDLRDSHESQIRAAEQSHDSIVTQLRSELEQVQRKLTETSATLASQTENVRILRQIVTEQKDAIAERSTELASTRAEAEDQQEALEKRFELERKRLIDEHEQVLAQLCARSEEQRLDIEKLTAGLAAAEKRLRAAKAEIYELKRVNLKNEKDIEAQSCQIEREQKLHAAAVRAAVLTAESAFAAKIEDEKSQWESEKRRILSFVADAFKHFIGAHESIDEQTIRKAVSRAKKELVGLTEANTAIRRIVGAEGSQNTVDAVAQMLMKKE